MDEWKDFIKHKLKYLMPKLKDPMSRRTQNLLESINRQKDFKLLEDITALTYSS